MEGSAYVLLNYTWTRMQPILSSLAWVEMYENQQSEWIRFMSDPRNLTARVRVDPGHGILELYYERYFQRSEFILSNSTFVRVANFDLFYRECPGFGEIREVCHCECFECYYACYSGHNDCC